MQVSSQIRKPEFLTFTGVDLTTDIAEMRNLSQLYPIEWGVLFSQSRQGSDVRYPDGHTLSRFWWNATTLRLAAHLCGAHSHRVIGGDPSSFVPVDLSYCSRVQVNHAEPDAARIKTFSDGWGVRCVAQCREDFPVSDDVDWLFDRSGGRGETPDFWPHHPGEDRLVGYAGGITPDNVAEVLTAINSEGPYWIDMESGVRTDNLFDLSKVKRVCEIVYGERS